MQNERARMDGASRLHSEGLLGGAISPSSSPTSSYSGAAFIEHRVSKMDTLAGIAIKYGVEVGDIKRANGLVTDGHIFAHKTLRIPSPGRHPPSPIQLNGAANSREQTLGRHPQRGTQASFQLLKSKPPPQHKVSPAMINLQGYYGLRPPKRGPAVEETEMTVYKVSAPLCFEDEPTKISPASDPKYLNHYTRSASLANGELVEKISAVAEAGDGSDEKSKGDKSVRRRQKADLNPLQNLDVLLMDDGGELRGRTGKGATSTGHSSTGNGLAAVRKSLSTSNLQEPESGSMQSSSKWTLKSDAINGPIFGGLPKPIAAWNKAALD